MRKRGEGGSVSKVEWVEEISKVFKQRGTSKSGREVLQIGYETSSIVWLGNCRTDEKRESRANAGKIENAEIFTGSDKDGQN